MFLTKKLSLVGIHGLGKHLAERSSAHAQHGLLHEILYLFRLFQSLAGLVLHLK